MIDNSPADIFYVDGIGTCLSAADESISADYDPMGYPSAPRIIGRRDTTPTTAPAPCVVHWQSGYCATHHTFDRGYRCPRVDVVDVDTYPHAIENLGRSAHGADSHEQG